MLLVSKNFGTFKCRCNISIEDVLVIDQDGLGKASKYRHRRYLMPINRVPIFSDSVSVGTDFIGTD